MNTITNYNRIPPTSKTTNIKRASRNSQSSRAGRNHRFDSTGNTTRFLSRKQLRRRKKLRSLFITLFLLCACFFGGRIIYQKVLLPYLQDGREAFTDASDFENGVSQYEPNVNTGQQNSGNKIPGSDNINGNIDNNITYISKYPVETPQARNLREIKRKLRTLSEEYKEFKVIYDNIDVYPENLLAALCNNPNMIDYVKGYLSADRKHAQSCKLTKKEKAQDFPLLIQWDNRWGYLRYGDDSIGLSGCAPTCLSMVVIGLTGDTSATPDAISKFAQRNGYYADGIGTKWSLMTEGCQEYNITSEELKLSKAGILSSLESGHPIICSMGAGDFTSAGHFIVLAGVKDGKIQVNDPNNRQRSEQLWDYETLAYQIKNMWVFYPM